MRSKVLFVDDEQNILFSMRRVLHSQFEIHTATSAVEGWQVMQEKGPFKVIVSDYMMPGINGMQFLVKVKELYPDSTRIMLTGQAGFETAVDAVNQGELFRFLSKPFPAEKMALVLKEAIKQYDMVVAEREVLEKTLSGTSKLLVDMLSITSPTAFGFTVQMRDLAIKICQRLEILNTWEIELGVSLSQLGALGLPSNLVEKAYGGEKLDPLEQERFSKHYETGFRLLNPIPRLESLADGLFYQGKNYDGGGLPEDKIKGKEIPLLARFIRLLFDYQNFFNQGLNSNECLNKLKETNGKYDPDILGGLIEEITDIDEGLVRKQVSILELTVGMIVGQDVRTSAGRLLLKNRSEINDINILRLTGLVQEGKVAKKIQVLTLV